jgi:phosphinothricin acetyltransferase
MSWTIRLLSDVDLDQITDIVNEHIAIGVAHFGEEPTSAADWLRDWHEARNHYPWLVAARGDVVAGLAYARRFNARAAYDWTAEVSVYIRDGLRGQGIGSALYRRLLDIVDAQGYRCLIAGITLPNEASVRLHESLGFEHLGTLDRVGYKHGAWRSVGSWQRHTGPLDDSPPAPIRDVSAVLDS